MIPDVTGADGPLRETLEHVLQQPDDTFYQQLLEFAERLAALSALPEDTPEVERLVEAFRRSGFAKQLEQAPQAALGLDGVFGAVMAEVTLSALSPAQRRFMRLIRHDVTMEQDTGAMREGSDHAEHR